MKAFTAKYVTDLLQPKEHQVLIVGGPYMHQTNPKWRTAAILKTVKSPYIHYGLTDFDEIWHADVEPFLY